MGGFFISLNLNRRHLDESQRAMVAERLATLADGQRKGAVPIGTAISRSDAAEALGVSTQSVARARKVRRDGVPELAQAVESGEVSVGAAVEVAKLPAEEQRRVVQQGPEAVREAAATRRRQPTAPMTDAETVEKQVSALTAAWNRAGPDARLWEIVENLHRNELTVQERAEHIAEWVRLTEEKVRKLSAPWRKAAARHGR